jgi:hypothetical protein
VALRMVADVPGGTGMRGLVRGISVLIGVVLILAAMAAAFWPLVFVIIVVSNIVTGDATQFGENDAQLLAVCCGVVLIGWWLGGKFIRGRRRVGLYLRKFGFAETTRTVSSALTSAVGRSVRLVTLDDSVAAPIGAGAGRRRFGIIMWLLAGAIVAFLVYYIFGGGYDSAQKSLMEQTASQSDGSFGQAIGAALFGALFAALFLLLIICTVVALIIIGFVGSRVHAAARRAERAASRMMRDERSVEPMARDIAREGRRIFAPRLVVVRVPTSFWQRAVGGLARACDLVVIDVSQPTDALVWEVQNMKQRFAGRWVLVGARDRVMQLADPATALAATPQGLLARMIDGEEVIVYGPTPDDQRRFARALRNRFATLKRA